MSRTMLVAVATPPAPRRAMVRSFFLVVTRRDQTLVCQDPISNFLGT